MISKIRATAAAAALTASLSVGVALAANGTSSTPSSTDPVSAASAAQTRAFRALAAPASEADRTDGLPSRLAGDLSANAKANLRLARRIGDVDALARTWLVPGDGKLCTVTDAGGRVTAGCVTDEQAFTGEALSTLSGGPTLPDGSATVSNLLPDGASNVAIVTARGTVPVTVKSNWVTATVNSPTAIEFDLGGKHRVVPVGALPE